MKLFPQKVLMKHCVAQRVEPKSLPSSRVNAIDQITKASVLYTYLQ
jgi:hypothetical protein